MKRKAIDRINESISEELEFEKNRMEVAQKFEESKRSCERKRKRKITVPVKIIGIQKSLNAASAETRVLALCEYKDTGWVVLVPAREMGFNQKYFEGINDDGRTNKYEDFIKKMINATIDVIILNYDTGAMKAIGSRLEAMKYIVEKNYFKSDKNGLSRIEKDFQMDKFVEARVITVASSIVIVDVLGTIVNVYARDVAWRYTNNLKSVVKVGDIVVVRIKELEINKETKEINMRVSIKEGTENILLRNLKRYTLGSSVQGTVSGIRNGYYVQVGDYKTGIDVYCKQVNTVNYEMPNIGDMVLVKLNIMDTTTGFVLGEIEDILMRKDETA